MQERTNKCSNMMWRAGIFMAAFSCLLLASQVQAAGGLWKMAGQSIKNTHHQKAESKISPSNVEDLEVQWALTIGGEVWATPAVEGKFVYFPDSVGNLYKVNSNTGAVVWERQFSEYTGVPGNFSRTTPAIHDGLLIVGDQAGRLFAGANVMAVDKNTGDLVWINHLGAHFAAIITQSATVHGDTVYVGVASLEEAFAAFIPNYECCTFRGFMAALNVNTGETLWQTSVVSEEFSGNAIWGSAPAVDTKRDQVYVATGNNYHAPQSVLDCVAAAGDDADAQRECLAPYPDNYFDSVLALDLDTGAVNWVTSVIPYDVWTVACLFGLPTCPNPAGPDFDFGQAPMLYSASIGGNAKGKTRDLVGVGQKSGVFWSLDPDTGEVVWATQVSPGGIAGGLQWGSAFDGNLIYTSSANSEYKDWTVPDGSTTNAGIWSALDPATGEIIWQTANPSGTYNAGGPVSVANGVVYACSQDPLGYMFALEAATGAVSWAFESGGSCNSGAAIVNGKVYWGSGYTSISEDNTTNDKFYSFKLPK
jgi:polyvinyl alcohol dehydrogenase (cytochrome)